MSLWLTFLTEFGLGIAIACVTAAALLMLTETGIKSERFTHKLVRLRRPLCLLAIVAGVSMTLFFVDPRGYAGVNDRHVHRLIENWRKHPPAAVTLLAGGSSVPVRDAHQISELFGFLLDSPRVSAHHSHPEPWVTFEVRGWSYTFELERDSKQPDEYWLTVASWPCKNPDVAPQIFSHFRSHDVPNWLKQLAGN